MRNRTEWQDHVISDAGLFNVKEAGIGVEDVYQISPYGTVMQQGTMQDARHFNNIEDSLDAHEIAIALLLTNARENGEKITFLEKESKKISSIILPIVLPAANWHTSGESEYGFVAEVGIEECRETYYPDVAIHKDSLKTAFDADVCTSVQSLDGKLRFWAKRVPAKDISATAALLISGISPVNPGGSAECGCDIKSIQVKLNEKEGI